MGAVVIGIEGLTAQATLDLVAAEALGRAGKDSLLRIEVVCPHLLDGAMVFVAPIARGRQTRPESASVFGGQTCDLELAVPVKRNRCDQPEHLLGRGVELAVENARPRRDLPAAGVRHPTPTRLSDDVALAVLLDDAACLRKGFVFSVLPPIASDAGT